MGNFEGVRVNRFLKWVLLAVTIVSFGCSNSDQKEKAKIESTTLNINFQEGDPTSLHPHVGIDLRSRILIKAMFEGLVRYDTNGKLEMAGAKSVEISPDGRVYTFTLRPHDWSNGERVKAQDYVRAWRLACSPDSPCRRPNLFYPILHAKEIKKGELPVEELGVEALDEEHLLVRVTCLAPYFLELLVHPIFSPLYDEAATIVNGPFELLSWVRGDEMILARNPSYFDREHVETSKIHVSMVTDPNTAMALFEQGRIDWVGNPFSLLTAEEVIRYRDEGTISSAEVARTYSLFCNVHTPLLSSKKVRQALSLAAPREELVEHLFIGQAVHHSPIPKAFSLVKGQKRDSSLALAKQLFQEGLQELGIPTSEATLELSYGDFSGQRLVAQALQDAWSKTLGLKVSVKGDEWNCFYAALQNQEFEIGGCYQSCLYPDASYTLGLYERASENTNFPGWEDEVYLTLMRNAMEEVDPTTRRLFLQKAEERIIDERPMIPLVADTYQYVISSKLRSVMIDPFGSADLKWTCFSLQNSKDSSMIPPGFETP